MCEHWRLKPNLSTLSAANKIVFREALYAYQEGKCIFCQQKMTLPKTYANKYTIQKTDATFEHLLDSWSNPDGKKRDHLEHISLSCSACNGARNDARQKVILDELRRKFTCTKAFQHFMRGKCTRDLMRHLGKSQEELDEMLPVCI